ncbi:hypothetical protein RM704_40575 [Streptomyces sp. DSM 3412]|uniref:Uncharacterized protein n=1 Tax=Streptomyces gottesmaniae TaxID=3075518 RepID=A0ABU2ZAP2_9ACTN|nr:hypothetical protein [Streptomyces sp. DSM 3412]MDT0573669.1 hypothetical protein [Streptomyces sp. DSM 3412]
MPRAVGEPVIVIDSPSPVPPARPPYEQLRAQLARQIQNRTPAVGTRLSTVRLAAPGEEARRAAEYAAVVAGAGIDAPRRRVHLREGVRPELMTP